MINFEIIDLCVYERKRILYPNSDIHTFCRLESSCCVGALCAFISDEELLSLFQTSLLEREGVSDWAVLQARATSLSSALTIAPTRIIELGLRERVAAAVSALATSDRIPVCESGLKSARSFVNHIGGDVSLMVPLFCQVSVYLVVHYQWRLMEICQLSHILCI